MVKEKETCTSLISILVEENEVFQNISFTKIMLQFNYSDNIQLVP